MYQRGKGAGLHGTLAVEVNCVRSSSRLSSPILRPSYVIARRARWRGNLNHRLPSPYASPAAAGEGDRLRWWGNPSGASRQLPKSGAIRWTKDEAEIATLFRNDTAVWDERRKAGRTQGPPLRRTEG